MNRGNRHTPREWFVVPLHIIEAAVEFLIVVRSWTIAMMLIGAKSSRNKLLFAGD
jgi:hypothetical protein